MDRRVKKFIEEFFEIRHKNEFIFHEIYGLTFVFEEDIVLLGKQLPSANINPIGIIYEENDEYYFAPLSGIDDLDEIVKEYVKNCL